MALGLLWRKQWVVAVLCALFLVREGVYRLVGLPWGLNDDLV